MKMHFWLSDFIINGNYNRNFLDYWPIEISGVRLGKWCSGSSYWRAKKTIVNGRHFSCVFFFLEKIINLKDFVIFYSFCGCLSMNWWNLWYHVWPWIFWNLKFVWKFWGIFFLVLVIFLSVGELNTKKFNYFIPFVG